MFETICLSNQILFIALHSHTNMEKGLNTEHKYNALGFYHIPTSRQHRNWNQQLHNSGRGTFGVNTICLQLQWWIHLFSLVLLQTFPQGTTGYYIWDLPSKKGNSFKHLFKHCSSGKLDFCVESKTNCIQNIFLNTNDRCYELTFIQLPPHRGTDHLDQTHSWVKTSSLYSRAFFRKSINRSTCTQTLIQRRRHSLKPYTTGTKLH